MKTLCQKIGEAAALQSGSCLSSSAVRFGCCSGTRIQLYKGRENFVAVTCLKVQYQKRRCGSGNVHDRWGGTKVGRGVRWCSAMSPIATETDKEAIGSADMKELKAFLERDLVHLFDEQGIDKSMYEKNVEFRDPITKYESLDGYLFNIQMLRGLFRPTFELHEVRQTGPCTMTSRWTMTMTFSLLPWNPKIVVTGTSEMGVNPKTKKFCSHKDYWDSLQSNEYFSLEAVRELLSQLQIFKTPDLETPQYNVLKKTAIYEVRRYEPYVVAETGSDKITGFIGFKDVAGYLFGKNSRGEKMKMTTPVFTQTFDEPASEVHLQFVLPLQNQLETAPVPLSDKVELREIQYPFVAAMRFSGKPTEEVVAEKAKLLRGAITKDGLSAEPGFLLARYNDPGRTWPFMMRNEVWIRLESFKFNNEDFYVPLHKKSD